MEQGLPAWGVCNLGHINLSKFAEGPVGEAVINYDDLARAVHAGVRFLDNVIDYTSYHSEENKRQEMSERRVGLGTLGLGELLIRCGLPYGKESADKIEDLYRFIAIEAYKASIDIAEEKGSFPKFNYEKHMEGEFFKRIFEELPDTYKVKFYDHGIRNVTLLTQAPTGSTGTMIGTSTGIEPYFSFSYLRSGRLGTVEVKEKIVNDYFEENKDASSLPEYFVTAMDISPEDHIVVQSRIQKWVDSSISKTVNVPSSFTIDDTKKLYEMSYDLGCKGVTIYRDGSRDSQVLEVAKKEAAAPPTATSQERAINKDSSVDRPGVVFGATEKISLPEIGKLYVTVNSTEKDGVVEVFVNSADGETEINALCSYVGRLISVARKYGVPTEAIIKQGMKVAGGQPFWYKSEFDNKGMLLRNIPNAVSVAIARFSSIDIDEKQSSSKCPSCGGTNYIKEEGCQSCRDCGHSKCS